LAASVDLGEGRWHWLTTAPAQWLVPERSALTGVCPD